MLSYFILCRSLRSEFWDSCGGDGSLSVGRYSGWSLGYLVSQLHTTLLKCVDLVQFAREKARELEDFQNVNLASTDLEGDSEPAVKRRKKEKQVLASFCIRHIESPQYCVVFRKGKKSSTVS